MEAEDHVQAGHRGQKLSQALPCGIVTTITGTLLHQLSESRSHGLLSFLQKLYCLHRDSYSVMQKNSNNLNKTTI